MSICILPKELQEKAKTELNEDPARTETYIQHIQEWLEKQPHLNVRKGSIKYLFLINSC